MKNLESILKITFLTENILRSRYFKVHSNRFTKSPFLRKYIIILRKKVSNSDYCIHHSLQWILACKRQSTTLTRTQEEIIYIQFFQNMTLLLCFFLKNAYLPRNEQGQEQPTITRERWFFQHHLWYMQIYIFKIKTLKL